MKEHKGTDELDDEVPIEAADGNIVTSPADRAAEQTHLTVTGLSESTLRDVRIRRFIESNYNLDHAVEAILNIADVYFGDRSKHNFTSDASWSSWFLRKINVRNALSNKKRAEATLSQVRVSGRKILEFLVEHELLKKLDYGFLDAKFRGETVLDNDLHRYKKLESRLPRFYRKQNKLPKLIEDDGFAEQEIEQFYAALRIILDEGVVRVNHSGYEMIDANKQEILPENLFSEICNKSAANRILLLGRAGVGKTTLMHYIAYQWARGVLYRDRFDYVFRVRLRDLTSDWRGAYYQYLGEGIHNELTCFMHYCLQGEKGVKVTDIANLQANKHKVLLLLDGYDEVAHLANDQASTVSKVIKQIFEYPNIIMTSRPNALDQNSLLARKFERRVENIGLDSLRIKQYVEAQLGKTDESRRILEYLRTNMLVEEACRTPINLAIICLIWQNPQARARLGDQFLQSDLYNEMMLYLGKRYIRKTKGADIANVTVLEDVMKIPVVEALKKLAFAGFKTGRLALDLKPELLREVLGNIDIEKVHKFGLLKADTYNRTVIDSRHEFIHLSFQEYLVAQHLKGLLQSAHEIEEERKRKRAEAAEFIAEYKYHPRFLNTMKILAGLVSREPNEAGKKLEIQFLEIIVCNRDGCIILDNTLLITLTLKILPLIGERDGIANKDKLIEYVVNEVMNNLSHYTNDFSSAKYQRNFLNFVVPKLVCVFCFHSEHQSDIAGKLLTQIGGILAVKEIEEKLLMCELLLNRKIKAIEVLKNIGIIALQALYSLLNNKENDIIMKCAAIEAIGQIKQVSSVNTIIEAVNDNNMEVKGFAIIALGEIGEKAKKVVLPILFSALKDKAKYVRYCAAKALGKIKSDLAIPELINALEDRETDVRREVINALGIIGNCEAKGKLVSVLRNEDMDMRHTAAIALGNIGDVAVVPELIKVLHYRDYSALGAVEAMAKIGQPAIQELIPVLKSGTVSERRYSVLVLEKIGGKEVIPALKVASGDTDRYVRCRVAYSLGKIRSAEAIPILIDILNDNDKNVRNEASDALIKIGNIAVPALRIACRNQIISSRIEESILYEIKKITPIFNDATDSEDELLRIEVNYSSFAYSLRREDILNMDKNAFVIMGLRNFERHSLLHHGSSELKFANSGSALPIAFYDIPNQQVSSFMVGMDLSLSQESVILHVLHDEEVALDEVRQNRFYCLFETRNIFGDRLLIKLSSEEVKAIGDPKAHRPVMDKETMDAYREEIFGELHPNLERKFYITSTIISREEMWKCVDQTAQVRASATPITDQFAWIKNLLSDVLSPEKLSQLKLTAGITCEEHKSSLYSLTHKQILGIESIIAITIQNEIKEIKISLQEQAILLEELREAQVKQASRTDILESDLMHLRQTVFRRLNAFGIRMNKNERDIFIAKQIISKIQSEQTKLGQRVTLNDQQIEQLFVDVARSHEILAEIQTAVQGLGERIELSEAEVKQLYLDVHKLSSYASLLESLEQKEASDQARKVAIAAIDSDPYKLAFYNAMRWNLNAVYFAALVVQTDIVKNSRTGYVGKFGVLLDLISGHIPLVGLAVKIFGKILQKVDEHTQTKMLQNYAHFVGDGNEMLEFSERISRELLRQLDSQTSVRSTESLLKKLIHKAIDLSSLANDGAIDIGVQTAEQISVQIADLVHGGMDNLVRLGARVGIAISDASLSAVEAVQSRSSEETRHRSTIQEEFKTLLNPLIERAEGFISDNPEGVVGAAAVAHDNADNIKSYIRRVFLRKITVEDKISLGEKHAAIISQAIIEAIFKQKNSIFKEGERATNEMLIRKIIAYIDKTCLREREDIESFVKKVIASAKEKYSNNYTSAKEQDFVKKLTDILGESDFWQCDHDALLPLLVAELMTEEILYEKEVTGRDINKPSIRLETSSSARKGYKFSINMDKLSLLPSIVEKCCELTLEEAQTQQIPNALTLSGVKPSMQPSAKPRSPGIAFRVRDVERLRSNLNGIGIHIEEFIQIGSDRGLGESVVRSWNPADGKIEIRADGDCLFNSVWMALKMGFPEKTTGISNRTDLRNIVADNLGIDCSANIFEYRNAIKSEIAEDIIQTTEDTDRLHYYKPEFQARCRELNIRYVALTSDEARKRMRSEIEEVLSSIDIYHEYMHKIRTTGAFGGEVEITILAKHLGINIKVVQPDTPDNLYPGLQDAGNVITLSYNGIDHYDLILSQNIMTRLLPPTQAMDIAGVEESKTSPDDQAQDESGSATVGIAAGSGGRGSTHVGSLKARRFLASNMASAHHK